MQRKLGANWDFGAAIAVGEKDSMVATARAMGRHGEEPAGEAGVPCGRKPDTLQPLRGGRGSARPGAAGWEKTTVALGGVPTSSVRALGPCGWDWGSPGSGSAVMQEPGLRRACCLLAWVHGCCVLRQGKARTHSWELQGRRARTGPVIWDRCTVECSRDHLVLGDRGGRVGCSQG